VVPTGSCFTGGMRQVSVILAAAAVAAGCAACGSSSSTSVLPPSYSAVPSSTPSPTGTARKLPIAVSAALSSPQQATSILAPASCTEQGGVLTATGTFTGGFVPEVYIRWGDVVELYAYTAGQQGFLGLQVANLAAEKPYPIGGLGPWRVTVPVAITVSSPISCLVAVQSTHAFMGAGNAGG